MATKKNVPLTEALAALAAMPTIGNCLKNLESRVSSLESHAGGEDLRSVRNELIKSHNELAKELHAKVVELEEVIEKVVESEMLLGVQQAVKDLEDLVMSLDVASTQNEEEPEKKEPTLIPVTLFGCLPRQITSMQAKLPEFKITHMKKPSKTTGKIFFCAAMADSADKRNIEKNNPGRVIYMQGAQSSWIKHIKSEFNVA